MLIPAHTLADWKKPPVVTLMLVLISALVFFTFQWNDRQEQAAADELYTARLLQLEWPYYETHLLKQNQKAMFDELESARQLGDQTTLAQRLGADRRFADSLIEDGKSFMEAAAYEQWRSARETYNSLRDSQSRFALGLDPQRQRPITYVTSLFLHPDILLLGMNIVLILTLGLALEGVLGGGRVLTGFLLSGIVGGLVHQMTAQHGVFPLTGASTAVAGLMGMYAARFRLQRQEFTYIAGTFTASTVLVWLLFASKEGAEWFLHLQPPVNLAAHAAALLAGAGFLLAGERWFPRIAETEAPVEEETTDEELAFRGELARALDAVGRMDFAEAKRRLLALSQQRPGDTRVLVQLYHVLKLEPQSASFDKIARHLFNLNTVDEAGLRQSLNLYRDYSKLSFDKGALDTETSLKLAMKFARLKEVKEADKILKHALDLKQPHLLVPKAALAIAQAYEELQDPAQADHFRQLATARAAG